MTTSSFYASLYVFFGVWLSFYRCCYRPSFFRYYCCTQFSLACWTCSFVILFIHKNSEGHSIHCCYMLWTVSHDLSVFLSLSLTHKHTHTISICVYDKHVAYLIRSITFGAMLLIKIHLQTVWDKLLGMQLTDYQIIFYFKCCLFAQSFDIQSICAVSVQLNAITFANISWIAWMMQKKNTHTHIHLQTKGSRLRELKKRTAG